jgi:hypothetical protein
VRCERYGCGGAYGTTYLTRRLLRPHRSIPRRRRQSPTGPDPRRRPARRPRLRSYDGRGPCLHGGDACARLPRLRLHHRRVRRRDAMMTRPRTRKHQTVTSRRQATRLHRPRAPCVNETWSPSAWSRPARRTMLMARARRQAVQLARRLAWRPVRASREPVPAPGRSRRWVKWCCPRSQRVPRRVGTVHTRFPAFSSVVTRGNGSLVVAASNFGDGAWRGNRRLPRPMCLSRGGHSVWRSADLNTLCHRCGETHGLWWRFDEELLHPTTGEPASGALDPSPRRGFEVPRINPGPARQT